jgi:hypothetical protein
LYCLVGCDAYGIGDDEDVGVRSRISSGLGKVTDDRGIGVEEICISDQFCEIQGLGVSYPTIAGHSRFPWYTSRDEDNFGILQCLPQAGRSGIISGDGALGIDMADIGGNTCLRREFVSDSTF